MIEASYKQPLAALRVPVPISIVQVQTTATTVFTARDDADFEVTSLVATNVTALDDTLTLHLVPNGGSPATANMIVFERTVPANLGLTVFNVENLGYMPPGSSLVALCGVNDALNLWGHGYQYQGVYE